MAGDTGKRPLPRLLALGELQERNRRAAEKELSEDRADCIAFLANAHRADGSEGIRALLAEAIPARPPRAMRQDRRSA